MNEFERLIGVGKLLEYLDTALANCKSDKEFVDFMLKKKAEAIQLSIELSVKIIIDRHCNGKK